MALTAGKYNNVEFRTLQIVFRDTNGYPQGQDTSPDTKSVPQTDHAYVVNGVMSLDPGTPVYPRVTNHGGGAVINKTPVSANDYGTPTFQLSQRDETLESFLSASTLDLTTNTARALRGDNVTRTNFPTFIVVMGMYVTLESGAEHWDHYIFPKCTIVKSVEAGGSQITGDVTNPNPLTYALDLSLSTRDATGMLLSASTRTLNGNQDARLYTRAASRLAYTTWTADGSATTFVLGYRPTSSSATGSANNNVAKNGVITTVTSISTTTGVVTVTAAGNSGDIYVVEYETDFVAI